MLVSQVKASFISGRWRGRVVWLLLAFGCCLEERWQMTLCLSFWHWTATAGRSKNSFCFTLKQK
jgi:hypothetical protein